MERTVSQKFFKLYAHSFLERLISQFHEGYETKGFDYTMKKIMSKTHAFLATM
jgi:hypothetical protein